MFALQRSATDATAYCKAAARQHGYQESLAGLASLPTQEVAKFVSDLLVSELVAQNYDQTYEKVWVGGTEDTGAATWRWVSGKPAQKQELLKGYIVKITTLLLLLIF